MEGITRRYLILDSMGKETTTTGGVFDQASDIDPILLNIIETVLPQHKTRCFENGMEEMKKLGWIDFENSSDKGHFRFYYKGALIYNLISEMLQKVLNDDMEALQVRTPFLYKWNRPDIQGQAGQFSRRLYMVGVAGSEPEFVLRFNGDVGAFQIMKDAVLTYKHLPIRVYENGIGFRYTLSGELSGVRRARAFSFPDLHSFCTDLSQGIEEYKYLYSFTEELAKSFGINLYMHFKTTEVFYPSVKKSIMEMLSEKGKSALVEIMSEKSQYWVMKNIALTDQPQRLFHIQLDLEDGHRYGIRYTDANNKQKNCTIVHTSLGTIERWMLIILEDALKKEIPVLPLWLAPIQVRIVPVKKNHLDYCIRLAQQMKDDGIRVDVDDRNNPLGWKIRAAEREWIPYILVLGDKEVEDGKLSVRIRSPSDQKEMNKNILVNEIKKKTEGFPYKSLPGMLVSKRPVFR